MPVSNPTEPTAAAMLDLEWYEISRAFEFVRGDPLDEAARDLPARMWNKLLLLQNQGNSPTSARDLHLIQYPGQAQINERLRRKRLPFRLSTFGTRSNNRAHDRLVALVRVEQRKRGSKRPATKLFDSSTIRGLLSQSC